MKRIIPFLLSILLLTGCSGGASGGSYEQITQEAAKEMMDTQEVIVLDVREHSEYDSGHIPGAVLLPVGSIDEETAAAVIPQKDYIALVNAISELQDQKTRQQMSRRNMEAVRTLYTDCIVTKQISDFYCCVMDKK